ncbi:MAG: SRPBCC domain-containing protein [Acidiferrobacterales bacterium]|nr:SRPBCC domain-containing protein [Acidiferrobacterales bacterium]
MKFEASIGIEAFADDIWRVLTDAPGWTEWDTTIDDLIGDMELNAKLEVYSRLSPERAFKVRVLEFSPPTQMVWKGGLPLGLFSGVRTFQLTPGEGAFTEVTVHEQFTGPLRPLFKKLIPDLQPVFEEFLTCLKKEVES